MSQAFARIALPPSDPAPDRRRGPGRPPKPIVDHPSPLWARTLEPDGFADALDAEMRRHGDTVWSLHKALLAKGGTIDRTTLRAWRRDAKTPESA